MSEHRYFWTAQYHWQVPNPEVDLIIQQKAVLSAIRIEWRTLFISLRSVSKTVSRYGRSSLRIRCRIWLSESHPAENNGEFIGYHTITFEEGESQEYPYILRRILESIEQSYFWLDGISSPWSGNHTPTPEPHNPLPENFVQTTPEGPITPPTEPDF